MAEYLLVMYETLGSSPRTGKNKTMIENPSSWVLKVCGFLLSCTNCVSIWNIDSFFPLFSKGYLVSLCWTCLGSRPFSQEQNQSLCRLQGIRKNFIDVDAQADSLPSSPSSTPGNSQQPRAVPAQLLSPWSLDFLPLLPVFC